MGDTPRFLDQLGRAAKAAGLFIGRKAKQGYQAVDPDVLRHVVQLPLLSYSLFVARHVTVEPGEPDGHPPLIFVHGLGGNRGNFLLMSAYLRLLGRKRRYAIRFDPGQSLDEMAEALAGFIKTVRKVTGEPQVEIVAHSLGGLVARLAILEHRQGSAVKTFVSLAAPHGGTYAARYANTATIKQLRPDADLIARVQAHPWPRKVRAVSFWSRNDLFILPAESAILAGSEAVEATPFTHYSYLISPKAWIAVGKVLAGEPVTTVKPG